MRSRERRTRSLAVSFSEGGACGARVGSGRGEDEEERVGRGGLVPLTTES